MPKNTNNMEFVRQVFKFSMAFTKKSLEVVQCTMYLTITWVLKRITKAKLSILQGNTNLCTFKTKDKNKNNLRSLVWLWILLSFNYVYILLLYIIIKRKRIHRYIDAVMYWIRSQVQIKFIPLLKLVSVFRATVSKYLVPRLALD